MKEFNNIRDLYDNLKKEMEDRNAVDYMVIRDVNALRVTLNIAFESWLGIPKAFDELTLEKYKVLNGYRFVLFSTKENFLDIKKEVNRILNEDKIFNENQIMFEDIDELWSFCEKLIEKGKISNYYFCNNKDELQRLIDLIQDNLQEENKDSIQIRTYIVGGEVTFVVSCEYIGMDYIIEGMGGE